MSGMLPSTPGSIFPYSRKNLIGTAATLLILVFSRTALAGDVTVQWNPVTSDPRVVAYEVHYGLASRQYSAMVQASGNGAATSTRTISGLTDGREYFFAVRARNADATLVSAFSNEVSTTLPAPASLQPVVPSISINDVSVNEGAGTAVFTLRLSASSSQPVGVTVSTSNGTATAGSDYSAVSTSLTIPAGTSSTIVTVAIYNDNNDEPNETFTVNLSGAVNGTIADNRGVGTIVDNDAVSASPSPEVLPSVAAGSAASTTVGLYDASTGRFRLRHTNTNGVADEMFQYGPKQTSRIPLVGDWDGDGVTSIGLFDPATSRFWLKNTRQGGAADTVFPLGPAHAGWIPLAGDWDGDGADSVGFYDPSGGRFLLKNANAAGFSDYVLRYGPTNSSWMPLAGDWDGDGMDSIGLYAGSSGTFYLRNTATPGVADLTIRYGPTGATWRPLTGDWNGDGVDTIGLFRPDQSKFYLRNSNSQGVADITLVFGPAPSRWAPIVGEWDDF